MDIEIKEKATKVSFESLDVGDFFVWTRDFEETANQAVIGNPVGVKLDNDNWLSFYDFIKHAPTNIKVFKLIPNGNQSKMVFSS